MAYPDGPHGEPPAELPVDRSGRIRLLGPLAALLVPFTLAVLALFVLVAWPCSGRGCVEPSLGAWVLVLFALPTALIAGLPWYLTPLSIGAALVSSIAVWMIFGAVAGRRTAQRPDAGWATFATEMLALTAGVVGGVLMGFGIIAIWIRL